MNKEERDKYLNNIIDEAIKKLSTNPKELFDYDKLQVKYNNLMKEKEELLYQIATKNNELIEKNNKLIDLQEENEQLKERINKAIEYINSYMPNYDFDHTNLEKLLEILEGNSNDK